MNLNEKIIRENTGASEIMSMGEVQTEISKGNFSRTVNGLILPTYEKEKFDKNQQEKAEGRKEGRKEGRRS